MDASVNPFDSVPHASTPNPFDALPAASSAPQNPFDALPSAKPSLLERVGAMAKSLLPTPEDYLNPANSVTPLGAFAGPASRMLTGTVKQIGSDVNTLSHAMPGSAGVGAPGAVETPAQLAAPRPSLGQVGGAALRTGLALGGAGFLGKGLGLAADAVLPEALAAPVARVATGAATGAAFNPSDPAVGALVGGGAGVVPEVGKLPDATDPLRTRVADLIAPRAAAERRLAVRAATTDALTGLANQGAFEAAAPVATADPNTAFVRFDVNGLKAVNDNLTYAHGNAVIQNAAQAVKTAADQTGVPARIFRSGTGDEITALVPTEQAHAFRDAAEGAYGVQDHGPGLRTSLSGGVGPTTDIVDAELHARKAAQKAAQGIPSRASEPAAAPPEPTQLAPENAAENAQAAPEPAPEQQPPDAVEERFAGVGLPGRIRAKASDLWRSMFVEPYPQLSADEDMPVKASFQAMGAARAHGQNVADLGVASARQGIPQPKVQQIEAQLMADNFGNAAAQRLANNATAESRATALEKRAVDESGAFYAKADQDATQIERDGEAQGAQHVATAQDAAAQVRAQAQQEAEEIARRAPTQPPKAPLKLLPGQSTPSQFNFDEQDKAQALINQRHAESAQADFEEMTAIRDKAEKSATALEQQGEAKAAGVRDAAARKAASVRSDAKQAGNALRAGYQQQADALRASRPGNEQAAQNLLAHQRIAQSVAGTIDRSDPDFQRYLTRYKQNVEPEFERVATASGLTPAGFRPVSDNSAYVPLPAEIDKTAPEAIRPPPPSRGLSLRTKQSSAVQVATGGAKSYALDVHKAVSTFLPEREAVAANNGVVQSLIDRGRQLGSPNEPLAEGEALLPLNDKNQLVEKDEATKAVAVPTHVADAYKSMRSRNTPPDLTSESLALRTIRHAGVATDLMFRPAVFVAHGLKNIPETVADIPSTSFAGNAANALIPLGRKIGAAAKLGTAATLEPENVAALLDISRYGGLHPVEQGRLSSGRLFGATGIDMRGRLVMDQKLQAMAPELTSAERAQTITEHLGNYVPANQPGFVRSGQSTGLTNFAPAGVAFTRGSIRRTFAAPLYEGQPLGQRATMLARTLGGAAATGIGLNYALSGQGPWSNQAGHRLDIDTGTQNDQGQERYVGMSTVSPLVNRALKATGVRGQLEGQGASGSYRDVVNTGLSQAGIVPRLAAALANAQPYMSRDLTLENTVPPQFDQESMPKTIAARAVGGLATGAGALGGFDAYNANQPFAKRLADWAGLGVFTYGTRPGASTAPPGFDDKLSTAISRVYRADPGDRRQIIERELQSATDAGYAPGLIQHARAELYRAMAKSARRP